MDLGSFFTYVGMVILQTLFALLFVVPIGGWVLWFACKLYNHGAGVVEPTPTAGAETQDSKPLKTTDPGPYTAPGSVFAADAPSDTPLHPDAVPVPNYFRACFIILCSSLAVIAGGVCLVSLFVWSFGNSRPPAFVEYSLFLAPLAALLLASAIHAAMLPTTFVRALLVNLLSLLPAAAVCISIFVACMAITGGRL